MTALVSKARELVIDATYGTNNPGMSLFAVLVELDGTGVPLCYLFLGTKSPDECSKSAQFCGVTISILKNFLQLLRAAGFEPTFFGCDKDRAEISAIRQIWPRTTVQLCYWHAKRAIRKKLKDGRKTSSQKNYNPEEAKSLVPSLEICWGSCPTSRPHGDHRYGRCQCISNRIPFSELGRLETGNVAERDVVLNIYSAVTLICTQ
ncbi:hypothetical protein K3495_g14962 [Podosphaera aphanis]|nr:hypothetical protein K3495_g14962 [Podosphaera aphanis]